MTDMKRAAAPPLPRDVYLAAFARTVSMLGNMIAVTALLLDLHERGAGVWVVSGLLAAGTLPIVLIAPVIGLLIDRYDSRRLIVATGLWQTTACAVLAFVVHPIAVLALVTLNTLGTALANPLFGALTRSMVPERQLAAANSLQQGGNMLAILAGPTVGGLLTGLTVGARAPLLIAAAAYLMITAAGLLIATRRRPNRDSPAPRLRDGITILFTERALAAGSVLAILLALTVHITYVAQVFLIRDTFGASELAFGLLQAVQTVGFLLGTVLASRLYTVRRIVICLPMAAVLIAASIALIGVIQSLPATFALYVVMGCGASTVSTSVGTLMLIRTPESAVGLALASFNAVNRAAAFTAYGVGGLLIGMMAPAHVYIVSGIASLLITLALTPAFRKAWLEN